MLSIIPKLPLFLNRLRRSELAGHLAAFRSVFLAVGGFSFAINLLMLSPAIYMLQVYDRMLTSRNETTLAMLSLILIGLFLLEAGLELVRARVLIRASAALDVHLSPRVFEASFEAALNARSSNPGAALAYLTNIRQFVTGKGLFAFFDAPWTPIYVLAIFLLHPWLGLFALLAVVSLYGHPSPRSTKAFRPAASFRFNPTASASAIPMAASSNRSKCGKGSTSRPAKTSSCSTKSNHAPRSMPR